MHISVTGVSHHETPVELRERFAFGADALAPALRRLPEGLGGAVLSTCNRSELYLTSETPLDRDARHRRADDGARRLAARRRRVLSTTRARTPCSTSTASPPASTPSSSASPRSSARCARRLAPPPPPAAVTPTLARLFHSALRVGRRARSETEIGAHGLSVAALAVSLSKRLLGDLRRKTVLVVGAGEVGQRAAAALAQAGAGRLLVTTRRSELATEIARELDGSAIPSPK